MVEQALEKSEEEAKREWSRRIVGEGDRAKKEQTREEEEVTAEKYELLVLY